MSEEATATQTVGKHVYRAIVEVQARLAKEGISKARKNQQQGYSFRGIDDVYNALATHLAEAKLCILPFLKDRTVTERTTKSGGLSFHVAVSVDFHFVSAVDDSFHIVKTFGEAMDTSDKATNKAMSAAYKYACLQTFCIPTEGDNDADASTHEVKQKPIKNSREVLGDDEAEWMKDAPAPKGPTELDKMRKAIADGDIGHVANHKIVTKSSVAGMLVRDAVASHSEIVEKNLYKFNQVDRAALQAFMAFEKEQETPPAEPNV